MSLRNSNPALSRGRFIISHNCKLWGKRSSWWSVMSSKIFLFSHILSITSLECFVVTGWLQEEQPSHLFLCFHYISSQNGVSVTGQFQYKFWFFGEVFLTLETIHPAKTFMKLNLETLEVMVALCQNLSPESSCSFPFMLLWPELRLMPSPNQFLTGEDNYHCWPRLIRVCPSYHGVEGTSKQHQGCAGVGQRKSLWVCLCQHMLRWLSKTEVSELGLLDPVGTPWIRYCQIGCFNCC